jgi:chromosome segregation ATPase
LQALIPRQREIDHTLRQLQRSIWGIESDIERTENDYKIGFTSEARGATVERIANLKTSLRNRQAEYRQLASEERSTRDQIHELQAELDGIAKRKLIP